MNTLFQDMFHLILNKYTIFGKTFFPALREVTIIAQHGVASFSVIEKKPSRAFLTNFFRAERLSMCLSTPEKIVVEPVCLSYCYYILGENLELKYFERRILYLNITK